MELTEGAVVAGRFRLVKQLGQGAMGTVWKAQHTGLDVPCAVKFIRAQHASSPEVRARFEREAKSAAQLRSPHVVQILDHGEWDGLPYMAMELLEGEELQVRLDREGKLPPAEVADIVQQITRALSKAHAMGLIHRDLKPSNIFLTRDGDQQIAKILDFGIVKDVSGDSHTRAGSIMGTPYYMSPEQARSSRTIDARADLWSLGVVAYRCVTGKLPFTAESMGDLLMKILSAPLPVPSQVAEVPAGFDAWWQKAASRDPAQRFQSAKELADALSAVLAPAAATLASAGATGAGPMSLGVPSPAVSVAQAAGPMSQGAYPAPMSQGAYPAPMSQGAYPAPMSQGAYPAAAAPGGYPAAAQGAYPPVTAPAAQAPPPSIAYPQGPYSTAQPANKPGGAWKIVLLAVSVVFVLAIVLIKVAASSRSTQPTAVPVLGGAPAPQGAPAKTPGKW
jgi:serine/threonine-protein kinase